MGKGRLTVQSIKFCELMAEGKKSRYECYIEAYPKAKNWTKASAQTAASLLLKKPHIQKKIEQLREKVENKLVEQYVWDKDKSTKTIMCTLNTIENNIDTLMQSRDKLLESSTDADSRIKAVNKVLFGMTSCARVVKELAGELNSMYGFNKSNIELNGSMKQVIFEGEDNLPPDEEEVDNNGNELVKEELIEDDFEEE